MTTTLSKELLNKKFMCYRVVRVSTGKELNDFIELPFAIYKHDRNWVAPIRSELKRILDIKRNPYFRDASLVLFNCYRDNKIQARISLSVNDAYNSKALVKTGFFGFFEAFNDPAAVKLLLDEVKNYCREEIILRLEGPFNPNLYSEVGMLCSSFDSPPTFFQTYNPEYYNSLLSENGFNVLEILHTRFNKNSSEYFNEKFKKPCELRTKELVIRDFDEKNTEKDLEHLRTIYNDAFSENWHFTPVSREEYHFVSKHLSVVTPPKLIKFVEYKGEPIAAVQFALDVNPLLRKFKGRRNPVRYFELVAKRKEIDRVLIFAVGIKKEFRNSRVTDLLFKATVEVGRKYKILETTWMYDNNRVAISLAEKLGMKRDKEFCIYVCDLTERTFTSL